MALRMRICVCVGLIWAITLLHCSHSGTDPSDVESPIDGYWVALEAHGYSLVDTSIYTHKYFDTDSSSTIAQFDINGVRYYQVDTTSSTYAYWTPPYVIEYVYTDVDTGRLGIEDLIEQSPTRRHYSWQMALVGDPWKDVILEYRDDTLYETIDVEDRVHWDLVHVPYSGDFPPTDWPPMYDSIQQLRAIDDSIMHYRWVNGLGPP